MIDQPISRGTAKLAEEKGLPLMLDIGSNCNVYNRYNSSERAFSYHVHIQYPDKDKYLFAPTQSLLQKWLREMHNMTIITMTSISKSGNFNVSIEEITKPSGTDMTDSIYCTSVDYSSYEEALEVGLQEALKLIK